MKYIISVLAWVCLCAPVSAQHVTGSDWDTHEHADTCIEINEVVVTGLTGTTKMKNSPSPISVINFTELRRQTSTNIIDAIAHKPGLSQITTGSGISKPIIRGLGFNRVVVVNDGIRQEGQQWGDEHGIELDGEHVNSVEILKGPASLRYGSDAMAGVIIFHDAPMPSEDGIRTTLTTGYQTNNGLFNYSLFTQGRQQQFFWNTRWSQRMAHAYKNKYDGYVYGSQFREDALSGLLGWKHRLGQTALRLSAFHTSPGIVEGERDEATGAFELPYDGYKPKTYGHPATYQQIHHYKAVLDNSLQLGPGTLKTLVGYQQNRRQEYEEWERALDLHLHTLNYDLHYHLPVGERLRVVAGLNGMWQQSKNRGEEFLIPDYRLFDVGLFATTSYDAGRWHLSGGLRIDRRHLTSFAQEDEDGDHLHFEPFRRHFTGVTGSLGTIYNLTRRWNIRVNLSRGFRAPNISELGSNGQHEGALRYEVGNHNLKPEYSWQGDLGIDYSSEFISAQLSLFANRISHYIYIEAAGEEHDHDHEGKDAVTRHGGHGHEHDGDSDSRVFTYTQGDAVLYGGELNVEMHPVSGLHIDNSFSYVCARQLRRLRGGERSEGCQPHESRYLPYTPPPRWNCDVRYEFENWKALHSGTSSLLPFVGAGMELNFRQSRCYEVNETETPTPSYTLFSLSAGADLNCRGRRMATISLTAQNLFNRAYQSHLSRLKYADLNHATGRAGVYNMGRNIAINLSVNL